MLQRYSVCGGRIIQGAEGSIPVEVYVKPDAAEKETGCILSAFFPSMLYWWVSTVCQWGSPASSDDPLSTPLLMDTWTVPVLAPSTMLPLTYFSMSLGAHIHTSAGMYHLRIELLSHRVYAYTVLVGRAQHIFMLKWTTLFVFYYRHASCFHERLAKLFLLA